MSYRIEPGVLADIASRIAAEQPGSGVLVGRAHELLNEAYPELIDRSPGRWVGSKAGGVLGKVRFLYFSPREYLVLFGSPTGTQGFSGRYKHVDIHKYLLAGRIDSYDLDADDTEPLPPLMPGQGTCLARGHARGLTIHPGSWHIEYGRGRWPARCRSRWWTPCWCRWNSSRCANRASNSAGWSAPACAAGGSDDPYLSMLPASTVTGRPVT